MWGGVRNTLLVDLEKGEEKPSLQFLSCEMEIEKDALPSMLSTASLYLPWESVLLGGAPRLVLFLGGRTHQ
jgi:hypothetical protein